MRNTVLCILLAMMLEGCAVLSASGTSTPFIITATLAPTIVPSATLTPIPPTPTATTTPVDGMTTTQVNVRSTPSTSADQLAILPPFTKVQIVGQDPDSAWFEIIFPQGPQGIGWVTAQYINVTSGKDTIPVIGGAPTPASSSETPAASGNGVLTQQVNVRKGPGTTFDALGTLNAKDSVSILGKDSGGSWLQIQYTTAPEGKGWIAAAYVQATGLDSLPTISTGDQSPLTGTPPPTQAGPTSAPLLALADGDSADAPAADVSLSSAGTPALIYSSDLSAPRGDTDDWVRFAPDSPGVRFTVACTGNGDLDAQLSQAQAPVANWAGLHCGQAQTTALSPGQPYLLHLSIRGPLGEETYVRYMLRVELSG